MRIDRAGWPFLAVPLGPAAALAALGRVTGRRWARFSAWPFLGLSAYMALFFRDPDRRCDHVGFVESQSPPPGTAVGPGTHVSIRVYGTAQGGCL